MKNKPNNQEGECRCKFQPAWQPLCGKPSKRDICDEHLKMKCGICGDQAYLECDMAGSVTCGYRLCSYDSSCARKHHSTCR